MICLTLTTTDNQMIAAREGAISVVLSVLKKHVSSESVCTSACGALCNITLNPGFYCDSVVFNLFLFRWQPLCLPVGLSSTCEFCFHDSSCSFQQISFYILIASPSYRYSHHVSKSWLVYQNDCVI